MGVEEHQAGKNTRWSTSDFPPPPHKPHKYLPDGVRNLTLAWDHPVNHPYNLATAQNFADAIVKHPRYGPRIGHVDKEIIVETFLSHAAYLYGRRKTLLKKSALAREKLAQRKKVDRRRKTVSRMFTPMNQNRILMIISTLVALRCSTGDLVPTRCSPRPRSEREVEAPNATPWDGEHEL